MKLKYSTRGSAPNVLKRETFNLEREVSPHIKRENLKLKREVSICGGLRMTTNSGMLDVILRTLPKLVRS